MSIFGNFFKGDNDEILFFILVFLLFNGNLFGKGYDNCEGDDNSTVLFFIIVFLLLFFGNGYDYNEQA